jgi:hypothetical protein
LAYNTCSGNTYCINEYQCKVLLSWRQTYQKMAFWNNVYSDV